MIRRPPRSTLDRSSAASDVYKRQDEEYWYANTPKYGKDWSIESRLLSPQDSRFRWLAGATYYEQDFITSTNGLLITTCYFSLSLIHISEPTRPY